MNYQSILISVGIIITLFSCSNSEQDAFYKQKDDESFSQDWISSSASIEQNKDTTRKFIRSADLKFRVKNVIQSTYDIEGIVSNHNGFVSYTNLSSQVSKSKNISLSRDSILETTYYTVTNHVTIRVPNTKLDTTLKDISRNIDFLDYRLIKAEDVSLQLLANKLEQNRSEKSEKRLETAIENKGEHLIDVSKAEDALTSKQQSTDNAMIANLSLTDQINYSTINLLIYQKQDIKREVVANLENNSKYEPSFTTKIIDSFAYGWFILEQFILFLSKLWGLLLFGIISYILYKRFWHKKN